VPTPSGIFILGELGGAVAESLHAISRRHDPRLAAARRPHITLAGSSGVGPMAAATPERLLRERLAPIAATTPPLELTLGVPERFPGTNIVALPVDPHGPIRMLHDRIASSGLHFAAPRFSFSPHVTLTLYRTLTQDALGELLAVRADGTVVLDRLDVYYTREPAPARLLLTLPLTGVPAGAGSAKRDSV